MVARTRCHRRPGRWANGRNGVDEELAARSSCVAMPRTTTGDPSRRMFWSSATNAHVALRQRIYVSSDVLGGDYRTENAAAVLLGDSALTSSGATGLVRGAEAPPRTRVRGYNAEGNRLVA